jgi:hypothetical protein
MMSFGAQEAVIASGEWRRPISATAAVERRLSVPGETGQAQAAARLTAWPCWGRAIQAEIQQLQGP